MKKTVLDWIVLVLVIIGGINWGLVGVFNFNVVDAVLGSVVWLENLVYILVGIAALYMIYLVSKK